MLTVEEIISFINLEITYEYESYDHKEAEKEYVLGLNLKKGERVISKIDSFAIPNSLKSKYMVKRIGKIRAVFYKNNKPYKFHIGHRRAKTFYIPQFGNEVKPIISKSNDIYGLIFRGFAIEK